MDIYCQKRFKMGKVKVTLLTTIRNKTNGGEYAKQVVRLLQNGEAED